MGGDWAQELLRRKKAFSEAAARILSSGIYFSLVRKPLQSEQ
jgi:hypothetical protein